jgi:tetratricopeptide (TPR) repeat protein
MRPIRLSPRPIRLFASASLIAAIALAAAGCQTTQTGTDTTGAVTLAPANQPDAAWRRDVEVYGQEYRADPTKVEPALRYAQALRATGQRAQAVAVLERLAMERPNNKTVLGEYGRALAEAGDYDQALDVLGRAHSPDQPDWHVLSAQGAVLDQMGRHAEAQRYYLTALKIVPDEPSAQRRGDTAPRRSLPSGRSAGAAEFSAGRRPARPLRRGRADRLGRPAAKPGRLQRHLFAQNAGESRPARQAVEAAKAVVDGTRRRHRLILSLLGRSVTTKQSGRLQAAGLLRLPTAAPSRGSRPGRESRRTAPAGRTRSSAR